MFNSKKGVSEVVANVLIVLLVIVGIAVIWSVVKPTIDKGTQGIKADCFTLSIEPVSCVRTPGGTASAWDVVIKRSPGVGTLDKVELLFSDGSNSERKDGVTSIDELVTTTVSADLAGTSLASGTGITVNTVITSGGQLCQITSQPVNCA